jgi:hypothetical protein
LWFEGCSQASSENPKWNRHLDRLSNENEKKLKKSPAKVTLVWYKSARVFISSHLHIGNSIYSRIALCFSTRITDAALLKPTEKNGSWFAAQFVRLARLMIDFSSRSTSTCWSGETSILGSAKSAEKKQVKRSKKWKAIELIQRKLIKKTVKTMNQPASANPQIIRINYPRPVIDRKPDDEPASPRIVINGAPASSSATVPQIMNILNSTPNVMTAANAKKCTFHRQCLHIQSPPQAGQATPTVVQPPIQLPLQTPPQLLHH